MNGREQRIYRGPGTELRNRKAPKSVISRIRMRAVRCSCAKDPDDLLSWTGPYPTETSLRPTVGVKSWRLTTLSDPRFQFTPWLTVDCTGPLDGVSLAFCVKVTAFRTFSALKESQNRAHRLTWILCTQYARLTASTVSFVEGLVKS